MAGQPGIKEGILKRQMDIEFEEKFGKRSYRRARVLPKRSLGQEAADMFNQLRHLGMMAPEDGGEGHVIPSL
jgi:hypothetical protein